MTMESMRRAVVLVSGGVNSCVAAAIKDAYEPALLHVRYPHRAAIRELECFQRLVKHMGVRNSLVAELPHLAQVTGNARVDRRVPIEDAAALTDNKPAGTYVPGLMTTMLSLAFNWATAIGATRIVVGISENLGPPGPPTAGLYPDHRREVLHAFEDIIRLSLPSPVAMELAAPLVNLTRPDVVRLGQRFSVPFGMTWSCYASDEKPCEKCYGCATRMRGFIDAGVPDPIFALEKKS